MANTLFDPAREGFLAGEIDWDTAVIKASPVRSYTVSAAHKFVSDVTGAGGVLVVDGSAAAYKVTLTTKGISNGVAYADDPTFTSVPAGAAIPGMLVYQASAVTGGADVAASAQRVIGWWDGIVTVVAAAAASTSATSVAVDPLDAALASGSTVVFGGVTATLTSGAAVGARTLAVSALSGGISQGASGLSSAQGLLPITPNGGDIIFTMPTTGKRWFKV